MLAAFAALRWPAAKNASGPATDEVYQIEQTKSKGVGFGCLLLRNGRRSARVFERERIGAIGLEPFERALRHVRLAEGVGVMARVSKQLQLGFEPVSIVA
jgi:hypothetical protein